MAVAPSGRPRQTAAESREAILQAMDELLRERPYRELSVEVVMEKADLSRTIFYRHFDGLPGLVATLLAIRGEALLSLSSDFSRNALSAKVGKQAPDYEVVHDSLANVVNFFAENGPLVKGVADASAEDAEVEAVYEGMLTHFGNEVAEAISGLVAAGMCDVADPKGLAGALSAMNERYLLRALGSHPQEDPKAVLDTIALVWSRALFGRIDEP